MTSLKTRLMDRLTHALGLPPIALALALSLALPVSATAQTGPELPAAQPAEQPEEDPSDYIEGEPPPPEARQNPRNEIDWGPRTGFWRGEITLPEERVLSFNFITKFHRDAQGEPYWTLVLRNGVESIPATLVNNHPNYTFEFEGTPARIDATLNQTTTGFSGEYIYTRKSGQGDSVEYRLPFSAEISDLRRFPWLEPPGASDDNAADKKDDKLPERWSISFDERKGPAIAEFRTLPDGINVYGTVVLPTGDDGHLAGTFERGRLRLSRFTGASGILYDGTLEADGTLIGTYRSLAHHAEGFTATPDANAELPDLFKLTKWNDGVELADLTFRDVSGSEVSVADLAPEGSPTLLYIMGTWCHNCADATRYLKELHKTYADHGLTIVGLAFESPKDFGAQAEAVRNYTEKHDLPFPILVAGQRDKSEATKTLRALDRVAAYPTIVFIDKTGDVVAVHQGFVGPAAPKRHAALKRDFTAHIETMLAAP